MCVLAYCQFCLCCLSAHFFIFNCYWSIFLIIHKDSTFTFVKSLYLAYSVMFKVFHHNYEPLKLEKSVLVPDVGVI